MKIKRNLPIFLAFSGQDNIGYFVSNVLISQAYLRECMGVDWNYVGEQARKMDTAITRFLDMTISEALEQ